MLCCHVCYSWNEKDMDFMVITSPHMVIAKLQRRPSRSDSVSWEASLSMSKLCWHLRAATYVTVSCLTTQNLALVWSAFWVSLILSGLTMSGWSLLFFFLAGKSAYSSPYSNRAKDSPRIHNQFYQGFMDVSNILKLKHWSAFIPSISLAEYLMVLVNSEATPHPLL